jgi:hypothetical protein
MDRKEIIRTIENLLVDQDNENFDEYWKKGYDLCRQLEKKRLILYSVKPSDFLDNS